MSKPLQSLQVVGVRYRGSRPAANDERALNAYIAANVYWEPGLPVTYEEPTLPEARRVSDEPLNLGIIGDAIARQVAAGSRAGRAVLVTGGDCSHAVGVFAGLQQGYGPLARIGLVWFDAHGDFNTPNTTLSGMLGGMPVAVCAGLGHPGWRELAGVQAVLPTDRIVFVDVRNLDPAEDQLIRAGSAVIAAVSRGRAGDDLATALNQLAARCDIIYLHIDSDILDAELVPNHGTREANGPDMAEVTAAIDLVCATGKVAALAVVSVYGEGPGADISVASGTTLIRSALQSWRKHGMYAPS